MRELISSSTPSVGSSPDGGAAADTFGLIAVEGIGQGESGFGQDHLAVSDRNRSRVRPARGDGAFGER
jgi:hypothetical protein